MVRSDFLSAPQEVPRTLRMRFTTDWHLLTVVWTWRLNLKVRSRVMPRNLTWGAVSIGWPPKDSLSSSGALREKEIAFVFSWEKLKPHSSDHELIESSDFWRIFGPKSGHFSKVFANNI